MVLRSIGATLAVLVALGGVGFVATGANLASLKFWGPKFEQARTDIFHQSQSYVDGMKREAGRLMVEYTKADEAGRAGICALARDTFSVVDVTTFNNAQRDFLVLCGAL